MEDGRTGGRKHLKTHQEDGRAGERKIGQVKGNFQIPNRKIRRESFKCVTKLNASQNFKRNALKPVFSGFQGEVLVTWVRRNIMIVWIH